MDPTGAAVRLVLRREQVPRPALAPAAPRRLGLHRLANGDDHAGHEHRRPVPLLRCRGHCARAARSRSSSSASATSRRRRSSRSTRRTSATRRAPTIDQTMIVGLGQAFDGTDPITVTNAPGLDPEHAANPACFQCHWSLDPMARFFRSNLTMNYSQQQDPAQIAMPGTFLFDSVVANGETSLYYLAEPDRGAPATSRPPGRCKLCGWANSGSCLANDPEVQRVAQVFASSNYNWNTLVHELFTSPLVTYASPTLYDADQRRRRPDRATRAALRDARQSTRPRRRLRLRRHPAAVRERRRDEHAPEPALLQLQRTIPPSRRATLRRRATDGCPSSGPCRSRLRSFPTDGYSRGVAAPLYINGADPFWRSSVEQICAYVADLVVDAGATLALFERDAGVGHDVDRQHGARPHGPRLESRRAAHLDPDEPLHVRDGRRHYADGLPSSRPSPRLACRPGSRQSGNERRI